MTSAEIAVRDLGVFHIGKRTVTIDDVICAAHFRGELVKSWQRVCDCAQCGTSGREADEADLQARSEEFRIGRDLISAEETERWLDERGLSLDDFSDFFIRQEVYNASASLSRNPLGKIMHSRQRICANCCGSTCCLPESLIALPPVWRGASRRTRR